jgi:hypothetical protein
MTSAQQKAVQRYRKSQESKGMVRLELTLPEKDRDSLREIAAILRRDDFRAEHLRVVLESFLEGDVLLDFKKFLELAPLEGLDFERSGDTGIRDVDL